MRRRSTTIKRRRLPAASALLHEETIMANHPRPAWQLRTLRWSAYTITVLLLLALISWLALPSLVKKIAAEQTQAKIGRKLDIGEVSFNPFILALRVQDVTLYEPDQKTAAFSAKELVVNASATSLPRLAAILDEVKMVDPKVHIVRLSDEGIGRYNFSDIIDRILACQKAKEKPSSRWLTCNCKTAPSCSTTRSLARPSTSAHSTSASPSYRTCRAMSDRK